MGEAKRRREAPLSCKECGQTERFIIDYYKDECTHIRSVAIQEGRDLKMIQASIEKTHMKSNVVSSCVRSRIWIRWCPKCKSHSISHEEVSFDRLKGYWTL